MLKVEVSTEIKRPVDEVFAYLTEPDKEVEWDSLVLEVRVSPPGALRVGSKIETVSNFLGRRLKITSEVTEYVLNRKMTMTAKSSPFPFEGIRSVEPTSSGTKVTLSSSGEPAGFFKLAEPVLARIISKQFQAQLDTLREMLESREPAKVGD